MMLGSIEEPSEKIVSVSIDELLMCGLLELDYLVEYGESSNVKDIATFINENIIAELSEKQMIGFRALLDFYKNGRSGYWTKYVKSKGGSDAIKQVLKGRILKGGKIFQRAQKNKERMKTLISKIDEGRSKEILQVFLDAGVYYLFQSKKNKEFLTKTLNVQFSDIVSDLQRLLRMIER